MALFGAIGGQAYDWVVEVSVKNCYNLGKVSNSGIVGSEDYVAASIELNIENCYNAGESSKAILGSKSNGTYIVLNVANTYYDKSKSKSVGVEAEGITALDEAGIKNNSEFVKLLNDNIGENTEWKKWKIGEDGWPTFEE